MIGRGLGSLDHGSHGRPSALTESSTSALTRGTSSKAARLSRGGINWLLSGHIEALARILSRCQIAESSPSSLSSHARESIARGSRSPAKTTLQHRLSPPLASGGVAGTHAAAISQRRRCGATGPPPGGPPGRTSPEGPTSVSVSRGPERSSPTRRESHPRLSGGPTARPAFGLPCAVPSRSGASAQPACAAEARRGYRRCP